MIQLRGFVAHMCLRPDFPLPQTDSAHSDSFGYAKSGVSIEDRRAGLDLCNLAIKISSGYALTKRFHTMQSSPGSGLLAIHERVSLNVLIPVMVVRAMRDLKI